MDHGFVRSPDGDITTFDVPHAGTLSPEVAAAFNGIEPLSVPEESIHHLVRRRQRRPERVASRQETRKTLWTSLDGDAARTTYTELLDHSLGQTAPPKPVIEAMQPPMENGCPDFTPKESQCERESNVVD